MRATRGCAVSPGRLLSHRLCLPPVGACALTPGRHPSHTVLPTSAFLHNVTPSAGRGLGDVSEDVRRLGDFT